MISDHVIQIWTFIRNNVWKWAAFTEIKTHKQCFVATLTRLSRDTAKETHVLNSSGFFWLKQVMREIAAVTTPCIHNKELTNLVTNYCLMCQLILIQPSSKLLPCVGRWAGAPHVMSIHPLTPSQEMSYRGAANTMQPTA